MANNASPEAYIHHLIKAHPSVSQIWLFGSRVDATNKPESDWDLLAFADTHTFEKVKSDSSLRVSGMDLLVVFDDDSFEQPWKEEGRSVAKRGSLSEWQWRKETGDRASYWCSRSRCRRTAVRLWPTTQ